jgi:hypothetical protein
MVVSFEEMIGQRGQYKFKSVCTYTPETGPYTDEVPASNTGNGITDTYSGSGGTDSHQAQSQSQSHSSPGGGSTQKQWAGKDVFLILKDDHFTLIEPDRENETQWGKYPISDLVNAINEFNTDRDMYDRVCLQEYPIGPYLHPLSK